MKNVFFALATFLCLGVDSAGLAADWQVHSIDNEGRGADGIRFADVNGDGLLDVASGWEEAGESRVYLHPGPMKVRESWPKVVVGKCGAVEDAVFCDLDLDGWVDVVSSSEDASIYIHWAPNSRETYLDETAWRTTPIPASRGVQKWMFTVPLQIDGRNGPDLLAAGKGNQVVWFEAPDNPRELSQWKMHVIHDRGGWTMNLLAEDMDGDGDQDVLLSVRKGNPGLRWLENPGHGPQQKELWTIHEISPAGVSIGFVTTADLDQDGLLDVVAPFMEEKKLVIYHGLSKDSTRWQASEIDLPKQSNKGVAVGDIDLDGRDDLVISHEFAEVYVLRHDGNWSGGNWTRREIAHGGKFDNVTLYDVDDDGDLDVFTTDERGLQVLWCENPGPPKRN